MTSVLVNQQKKKRPGSRTLAADEPSWADTAGSSGPTAAPDREPGALLKPSWPLLNTIGNSLRQRRVELESREPRRYGPNDARRSPEFELLLGRGIRPWSRGDVDTRRGAHARCGERLDPPLSPRPAETPVTRKCLSGDAREPPEATRSMAVPERKATRPAPARSSLRLAGVGERCPRRMRDEQPARDSPAARIMPSLHRPCPVFEETRLPSACPFVAATASCPPPRGSPAGISSRVFRPGPLWSAPSHGAAHAGDPRLPATRAGTLGRVTARRPGSGPSRFGVAGPIEQAQPGARPARGCSAREPSGGSHSAC